MHKKIGQKSISVVMILAMIFSMFGIITLSSPQTYAAGTTEAKAENNKVVIPAGMKYGKSYSIIARGDRYDGLYKSYQNYLTLKTANTGGSIYDIKTDDVSMFTNGETAYITSKMVITKEGYYPQTFKFSHNRSSLDNKDYKYENEFAAGKYQLKTEFVKCSVLICENENSSQEVYFNEDLRTAKVITNTFYVASKVKLNYNSRKGKLAKKHRTKYLNPTKKFGKLPSPKAKRGYEFIGWYSKKTGGKKITKATKVPSKNTQTIYARYKKK